ncbi:MAG TPA: SPW repeat protein [Vicinamibacterales bacterium]|nr:SPW repeat protein [Vicinamibacterales bacterium]
MKALSWINFILGLWMIVAGFALSTASRAVMTEEIIVGIIIAALACAAALRPAPITSLLVAIAGLWTLLAPSFMNYMGMATARRNDLVVGIVVLVLGIVNAVYRPPVPTHA